MKTVPQSPASVEVEHLDATLKTLFGQTAEELAAETGFIRRHRKLTGSAFAQALVFGWLSCPDASYTQLKQSVSFQGCKITPQGLEKRMSSQAADFLRSLLYASMEACIENDSMLNHVLQRFEGIYLQDGTVVTLPNELEGIFKGCGGSTQSSGRSGLRIQVRLNLATGALQGPWIQDAAACEREGEGSLQQTPLPTNALWVVDALYPTLKLMKQLEREKKQWITTMKADMVVFNAAGVKQTLPQFIAAHGKKKVIDEWIQIGATASTRQRVRVVAFKVSEPVAEKRREKANGKSSKREKGVRRESKVGKKQQPKSDTGHHRDHTGRKRLELLDWTILLTNVPAERLSAPEVRVIMRARWQIELLWRLWKERGQIDIWRSEKPMRILCEIYAKLLAMVVQHWIILTGCWHAPDRSMVKASLAVQSLARTYALTMVRSISSVDVLQICHDSMDQSRLNCSTQRHSTASLLENPSLAKGLS